MGIRNKGQAYPSGLILMFRNQIGAPPCLPCKPIAPLVGWELRGLFNQGGIFEPSGFSVPDLQRVISNEVTGRPFRITSIFGPGR